MAWEGMGMGAGTGTEKVPRHDMYGLMFGRSHTLCQT